MVAKLVACGFRQGGRKRVEIDRSHFATMPKSSHLKLDEIVRLIWHLAAAKNAATTCESPLCEEDLNRYHAHIVECRDCRSQMQAAVLMTDLDCPDDRPKPDLFTSVVNDIHISFPPNSPRFEEEGLHIIDDLDELSPVDDLESLSLSSLAVA